LGTQNATEILRQSLIFSGLRDDDISEFSKVTSERHFSVGDFIFWEGDEPEWFYIVSQGKIKVVKHASSGREFIIAFFDPGEMFGEVAVFENKPYPASAQAAEESIVLGIKKSDFLGFLAKRPEVALRIIQVLSGRLRDAQARLKDIAGERVEQRIASILLMISSKLGSEIPFTREEIANMAGTTTETTIRVMSRFKDEGVVQSKRGMTIIVDEDKLKLLGEGISAV